MPTTRRSRARRWLLACGFALLAMLATELLAAEPVISLESVLKRHPDAQHGAELFKTCLICHGTDAMGVSDGNVPVIAGQHIQVIEKQVLDFRSAKRWDISMERIADRHFLSGAQDIADIAGYVSRLERTATVGTGDGTFVEHGEELYAMRCASCHGSSGEGNGAKLIPRLAGQHYEYLLRQIYNGADGRRPNFSRAHIRLFQGLVMQDIRGVADFLSRIDSIPAAIYDVSRAVPQGARAGGATTR